MNCHINFHQLESTEAIKSIVEKKTKKLEKFFSNNVEIEWFLEANKEGHHARAILSSEGYHVNAHSTTEDLYRAIDEVEHKMESQIKKQKEKLKTNKQSNPEYYDDSIE